MSDSPGLEKLTVLVLSHEERAIALLQDGLPESCRIVGRSLIAPQDISPEIAVVRPDLIAVSAPVATSEMIALAEQVMLDRPCPVIVFVDSDPEGLAAVAIRLGVASFVVNGMSTERIGSLVTVALERFKRFRSLEDELQRSRDSLAARKTIERAKGLLMKSRNLSEQEAYEALRTMAMRQGKSLKSVCESVIAMSDLLP